MYLFREILEILDFITDDEVQPTVGTAMDQQPVIVVVVLNPPNPDLCTDDEGDTKKRQTNGGR